MSWFLINGIPSDVLKGLAEDNRRLGVATNPEVIDGFKAVLTEDYVQRNIKKGYQWEASSERRDVPAGQSYAMIFTTGSKPILIKAVIPQFRGESLNARWFESPTFTGGDTLDIINPNRRNQQPLETVGLQGITGAGLTITSFGTPASACVCLLGDPSQSSQQRTPTTLIQGFERVFAPNTTYLLRFQNPTETTVPLSVYMTFYEGDLSVDLPPAL